MFEGLQELNLGDVVGMALDEDVELVAISQLQDIETTHIERLGKMRRVRR